MKKYIVLALLFLLLSTSDYYCQPELEKKDSTQSGSDSINKLQLLEHKYEIKELKKENSKLDEKLKDIKIDFKYLLDKQNEHIDGLLDNYSLFLLGLLGVLGIVIKIISKPLIIKRVEKIIKDAAQKFAKIKTDEAINKIITDEYIANIIREKGEPEIKELIDQLKVDGQSIIDNLKKLNVEGKNAIDRLLKDGDEFKYKIDNLFETMKSRNVESKVENPKNPKSSELLNFAYTEKDPKRKIELYKEVLKIERDDVEVLNNIGMAYESMSEDEEAIIYFNKAIKLDNNHIETLLNRTLLYIKLGKKALSLKDTNRIIEIEPLNIWANIIKGMHLMEEKEYDTAEQILTDVIIKNPVVSETYYYRGQLFFTRNLFRKAEIDYLKAEKLNFPEKDSLYRNLGFVYFGMGKADKAIKYLDMAIQINPKIARAYEALALIYLGKEDKNNFYKFLRLALDTRFSVWSFLDDSVFDPYRNEKKFIDLVAEYKDKNSNK